MRHSATEHPISWFADREREGNLVLQPRFQRRRVWTDRQKSNLIESILLQLPIPELYMQIKTEADGRSEYVVVDGQQRITAILEFIGVNEREPFELQYLDDDSQWSGYVFGDLSDGQKAELFGHSMAVRYLHDAADADVEDLFRRLNKYVTTLNAQELRNATYRGPFFRLSERLAQDSYWSENRLATPEAIRRMRDIEFVSDLLIGVLHGPQSGNRKTLDDYYAIYEDYEPEFRGQRSCRRRFLSTLELIQQMLPDIRTTRWSNKTDFYSLFVAIADLSRRQVLLGDKIDELRTILDDFSDEIVTYQADDDADVWDEVVEYVGAIRRGSSDRHRRGVRHGALLSVIAPFFRRRSR